MEIPPAMVLVLGGLWTVVNGLASWLLARRAAMSSETGIIISGFKALLDGMATRLNVQALQITELEARVAAADRRNDACETALAGVRLQAAQDKADWEVKLAQLQATLWRLEHP